METGTHIDTRSGRWIAVALLLCSLAGFCGAVRAQDVKPSDRKAYAEALARYDKRQYREAAQQMRRVAGRNPQSADAQFWLGMMAVKDGFNATAIRRYFTRCTELNPDYPDALAHYYMGVVRYTDDRYDDAVAELERYFALANGSDNAAWNAVYEEASNYLHWSRFLGEAVLNMAPFEPERVGGVSSVQNEMLPCLALDGQTFYYLREVPASTERTFYSRELEQKQWRLYSSKLLGDTAFSRGTALPAPFNSGDPEGSVSLTADGSELYYSVIRSKDGYANSDIYRVRRVDGKWQQPENCGPQVNGDRTWESQPAVSADGSTLVFASNRKGGVGGIDLWRCHRLKNGDWSRAENLGSAVNTTGNEKAPFLAADGRTLYFLSDGWQGFGGYDVYFSNIEDPYGNRPTNLGLPINSEGDELSFGVTADGRRAYFGARTEGTRSSDIFMFDLYPAARPEPMVWCRIAVADTAGRPLVATVKSGSGLWRADDGVAVVMLSAKYDEVLTFSAEGMLPVLRVLTAAQVRGGRVGEGVTLQPLAEGAIEPFDPRCAEALAGWLIDHPRVRLAVECPDAADAQAIVERMKACGLRPDRLVSRGGTDVKQTRIRVL